MKLFVIALILLVSGCGARQNCVGEHSVCVEGNYYGNGIAGPAAPTPSPTGDANDAEKVYLHSSVMCEAITSGGKLNGVKILFKQEHLEDGGVLTEVYVYFQNDTRHVIAHREKLRVEAFNGYADVWIEGRVLSFYYYEDGKKKHWQSFPESNCQEAK